MVESLVPPKLPHKGFARWIYFCLCQKEARRFRCRPGRARQCPPSPGQTWGVRREDRGTKSGFWVWKLNAMLSSSGESHSCWLREILSFLKLGDWTVASEDGGRRFRLESFSTESWSNKPNANRPQNCIWKRWNLLSFAGRFVSVHTKEKSVSLVV